MIGKIRGLAGSPGSVGPRELAAVAAALLLLGVLFTWPLARHLSTDVLYTHRAHPGYERVPIAHGDHLQLLYLFWLFGDSVREGRAPFTDPYQFRDGGPAGFFFQPSLLPALTFLLSPLGLVAAYNLLTLLSFVGAGLATHLLLRLEIPDRWAAFAGALVVALFPYRVAQLAGHANGFLAFLIPLHLYLFERSLRGARWAGWACAAGVVFFLAGAMEFHIVYYLALLLAAYLPLRFVMPLSEWLEPRAPGSVQPAGPLPPLLAACAGTAAGLGLYHAADRVHRFPQAAGWAVTAAVCGAVALLLWRALSRTAARYLPQPAGGLPRACALPFAPLLLMAAAPLARGFAIPGLGKATVAAALLGAAALTVPLLRLLPQAVPKPQARALLRGRALRYLVHLGFIGATFAFLLLVRRLVFSSSVAGGGRRFAEVVSFSPHPADLVAAVGANAERAVYVGLVAAALALVGLASLSRVEDPGRRGRMAFLAGAAIVGLVLAVGPNLDLLPIYHLLFRVLPMFNFPRVSGRILLVASVGLAALVAAGLAALRRGTGRGAGVLTLFAVGLLAADYLPRAAPGLTTLPLSHPVYDRLASERAPGETILELPIWPGDTAWSSVYLWYVTRYRTPLLNGYSPATPRAYVERIFQPLYPLDFGEMRRPQYELLRSLGVRFVVFHEEAYPPKVSPFPFRLAVENLRASPYLETVAHAPPLWLFRLRPEPRPASTAAPISPVAVLWEGEAWGEERGRRSADAFASGGVVASFPPGASGVLNRPFPSRTFPAGGYRVESRFLADLAGRLPRLTLTVRLGAAGTIIGSAEAPAGAVPDGVLDLGTDIALDAPGQLSVELGSDGSAPVAWDYTILRFSDAPEPQLSIEVEDLWHMGIPLDEGDASGGQSVELVPGYNPRDYAFSGPDRVLPAGSWVARLRFAGGDWGPSPGPDRFEAGLSNVEPPLAAVPLPPTRAADGYREAALPFALQRSGPVRFRVSFTGQRRLKLDRITIAPQESPPPAPAR